MNINCLEHGYKVGIYVRESRDENEQNIETIETQRDLLVDFVKRNALGEILKIYMDDNISGSGFERDGINQLEDDVYNRKIDMLLLKDLSRLGRNNAKTLLFLDFLEEHGVRVLTCDGKYDSVKDNDTVGIETWFNERYVRDISKKIRTNLRFKIARGEYIGHAPFGYRKSNEKKNHLCIDEETAWIVREIYRQYRQGMGYAAIAKALNDRGLYAPSGKSSKWSPVAVRRVLSNRVYIGDTVQGISEKISFKSKKTRRLPESRWVITEQTHEAIIERDEFDAVQQIIEKKGKRLMPHKGKLHLLRGMLYCGKCGSVLFARSRKNRPMGYICSSYGRGGRSACTSHYVSEQLVGSMLQEELIALFRNNKIKTKVITSLGESLRATYEKHPSLDKLVQQLEAKKRQQELLYMDRLEARISEELFSRMNQQLERSMVMLDNDIREAEAAKHESFDASKLFNAVAEDIAKNGVTRDLVEMMVDRIVVFDPGDREDLKATGRIAVDFRFCIS